MRRRYVLEGAGLALLLSLPLYWMFLDPSMNAIYHSPLPLTRLLGGLLLDMLILFLLITGCLVSTLYLPPAVGSAILVLITRKKAKTKK